MPTTHGRITHLFFFFLETACYGDVFLYPPIYVFNLCSLKGHEGEASAVVKL